MRPVGKLGWRPRCNGGLVVRRRGCPRGEGAVDGQNLARRHSWGFGIWEKNLPRPWMVKAVDCSCSTAPGCLLRAPDSPPLPYSALPPRRQEGTRSRQPSGRCGKGIFCFPGRIRVEAGRGLSASADGVGEKRESALLRRDGVERSTAAARSLVAFFFFSEILLAR